MQSETTSLSQPSPESQSPKPLLSPALTQPLASEVASKLQSADTPLDFVKRNLAAMQKPQIDPQASVAAEEAKRAEAAKVEAEKPAAPPEIDPMPTPPIQEAKAAAEAEVEAQEPALEEPAPGTAAANFKQVRKVLHDTKSQLTQAQEELNKAKEELEKYKTGEVLPDALAEKEAEIARLSKYEKVVALKTSKEFQDKFVKPITSINNKLVEIAKDYNIPPETLKRTLSMTNRADLNRFLSQHFDDVGALEVKQLITQVQDLSKEAKDAEQEPQSALQQLIQDGEKARQERTMQSKKELQTATRTVWKKAFDEVVADGKAQELIYRPDDPTHNKNYVEPIVKQAASEFGKIITQLAENGLEKMPEDLGHALATAVLLAHASAVSLETRDAAVKHAEEVENNASRLTKIYRPPVGSMTPGAETVAQERKPMNPTEAGRTLINSVLAKKKA